MDFLGAAAAPVFSGAAYEEEKTSPAASAMQAQALMDTDLSTHARHPLQDATPPQITTSTIIPYHETQGKCGREGYEPNTLQWGAEHNARHVRRLRDIGRRPSCLRKLRCSWPSWLPAH